MRTRSPFRNTRSGSTRTARPFESRLNNVRPRPRRAALTGFDSGFFTVGPGEPFEPLEPFDVVDPPDFSGELDGVALGRGRFLGGLDAEPDDAGLSFGRVVRNAPRTSPSSCGGGTATAKAAHMRTSPKRIALNRIT